MSVKVSVIVPIYNVEKYLQRALDSVCNQTLRDIEILCIDDDSTDDSANIMKANAARDSRIHCFWHGKNHGLSASRNTGMKEARGEYLYFVDSDDWILPETLELLYKKAKVEKLDILYSSFQQVFENEDVRENGPKIVDGYNGKYTGVYTGEDLFVAFGENKDWLCMSWLGLYRTNYLKENGIKFYEGIFHEDVLFYPEALLSAKRTSVVNQPLYQYFRRYGSITEQPVTAEHFRGLFIVVSELRQWLLQHPLLERVKKAVAIYAFRRCFVTLLPKYFNVVDCDKLENLSFDTPYQKIDYLQLQATMMGIPRKDKQELAGKHILIYGAGIYSRNIAWQLSCAGINQFTFVVTKKKEGQYFLGSPVYEITEFLAERNTAVVVLAVGQSNLPEMRQNAQRFGFQHIIELEETI